MAVCLPVLVMAPLRLTSKIRLCTNESLDFRLGSKGERRWATRMINLGVFKYLYLFVSIGFAGRDALLLFYFFKQSLLQCRPFYFLHVVKKTLGEDKEVSGVTFLNATGALRAPRIGSPPLLSLNNFNTLSDCEVI